MNRIYDRTATGSLEDRVNQLQSRAWNAGMTYLRWGTRERSVSGEQNAQSYGRALALAEALEVMTGGDITADEFAKSVREAFEAEQAQQAQQA